MTSRRDILKGLLAVGATGGGVLLLSQRGLEEGLKNVILEEVSPGKFKVLGKIRKVEGLTVTLENGEVIEVEKET